MEDWQPETRAIRGQMENTHHREHSTPLYLTSSFTFPTAEAMADTFAGNGEGIIYSRYNNPNVDELIAKTCTLEGMETGFATGSGMAAVFGSIAGLVSQGDHIIATRAVFGSTHQILTQLLPRWGITHTYVEPENPDDWASALRPESKLFITETPSNPGLKLVDLSLAGAFCKQHELTFIVDNCFATPYLQRPGDFGADIVTHSATKWMDGQGRVLGGLILGSEKLMERIVYFCRHTGPAMSPFNAWVISKSLETLHVRMEAHCRSAEILADWLVEQTGITAVHYPFLDSHPQHELARRQMSAGGGIVTFELAGGIAAAQNLLNRVQLCTRSSNLGDTRTILTHPATTTHSKLSREERDSVGITDGLIRMSVGLEAVADLKADLLIGLS